MARVEPIRPSQWPPEMRPALAAMIPPAPRHPRPLVEGRPKALNALGTFAHHPELAHAFFTFNGHVLMATTLTLRQRELLVLRVAALRRCGYEWAQHAVIGPDVGLTADEIARILVGPDAPGWAPVDAALLQAADDLLGDGALSDATWGVLATAFDTQQVLDLIFTIGAYEMMAFMMRSFALDLDDDLPEASRVDFD
jgi:alkylhydroperoxidase family enzyme